MKAVRCHLFSTLFAITWTFMWGQAIETPDWMWVPEISVRPFFSCEFLPTAYVVRRESNVLTRVCLSTPRGGTPARSSREGGTPPQVPPPDLAREGGTLAGGTPPWVPPYRTWPGGGYTDRGYPSRGVPHLRYPPLSDLAGGYLDEGGGGLPRLVQDNRWSTWYAAVGMPLAFTQEDCLVFSCYGHFSHANLYVILAQRIWCKTRVVRIFYAKIKLKRKIREFRKNLIGYFKAKHFNLFIYFIFVHFSYSRTLNSMTKPG